MIVYVGCLFDFHKSLFGIFTYSCSNRRSHLHSHVVVPSASHMSMPTYACKTTNYIYIYMCVYIQQLSAIHPSRKYVLKIRLNLILYEPLAYFSTVANSAIRTGVMYISGRYRVKVWQTF